MESFLRRERQKGLYTADQNVRNDRGATATRHERLGETHMATASCSHRQTCHMARHVAVDSVGPLASPGK